MSSIIINLMGAPGAGKSTGAAYIFSQLKLRGINAELVTEYAKDKVWEESKEAFKNQIYLFGKQYFRLSRCMDKVDVIVTDSPLFLSMYYAKDSMVSQELNALILKIMSNYENYNYYLHRVKKYNPIGRLQTQEESDAIKSDLLKILDDNKIPYVAKTGCQKDYDEIVEEIINILEQKKNNA
jgi:adenylate kinase family enzyme